MPWYMSWSRCEAKTTVCECLHRWASENWARRRTSKIVQNTWTMYTYYNGNNISAGPFWATKLCCIPPLRSPPPTLPVPTPPPFFADAFVNPWICYIILCHVMLCYVMLCYVMLFFLARLPLFSPKFHYVFQASITLSKPYPSHPLGG